MDIRSFDYSDKVLWWVIYWYVCTRKTSAIFMFTLRA